GSTKKLGTRRKGCSRRCNERLTQRRQGAKHAFGSFASLREMLAMILEGIVTTVSVDGQVNIAPMGPRVDAEMQRFVLRPFPTSQTYRNLVARGEGVLHVTDDVLLLAKAAVGEVEPVPAMFPAARVSGYVLADACRYYEFRVTSMNDGHERAR